MPCPMPCPMPLENRIRRLRFDAGRLTQKNRADRVHVTSQTAPAIKNGIYAPALNLDFRLARTFGKPLGRVFTFDD